MRAFGRIGNPIGWGLDRKELKHALDYFCDSLDHVGAGTGHFVHNGWIHSYPIGHCSGDASDQSLSGAKSVGTISV